MKVFVYKKKDSKKDKSNQTCCMHISNSKQTNRKHRKAFIHI